MARTPGKKPQPTFLKLVKGTPKGRINKAEALPPRGLPTPPAHLSDEAKVEWGRVSQDLYDMGVLTKIDRAALAAYCQAYGRWQQAEEDLADFAKTNPSLHGLVIRTKSGNHINNPLLGVANKAMADMMRYATDLGMTPSARSRIETNPDGAKDPASKYLG